MSFFTAVQSLVQSSGKLTITLFPGADGKLKVCVVPSAEKGKDAALATPLTLVATAAELDEGFVEAIQKYQTSHASLADQVAATTAILEQAKKTSSNTAVKALSGKSAPKIAPAKNSGKSAEDDDGGFGLSDGEDNDNDNGEENACGTSAGDDSTPPVATASHAAPASAGTDLGSLI